MNSSIECSGPDIVSIMRQCKRRRMLKTHERARQHFHHGISMSIAAMPQLRQLGSESESDAPNENTYKTICGNA